jgi:uncharacterized protein YcbX
MYYPLKSGTEIETNEAAVSDFGIVNDRVLCLIDKQTKKFLNIKRNCKIYYIQTRIINNTAFIKIPTIDKTFEVNLESETKSIDNSRTVFVNMYGIGCNGLVLSEELNKALSDYLQQDVLLVYCIENRKLKEDSNKHLLINFDEEKDKTYFADLAPFLIASEESLEELNKKLVSKGENPVKMINFRPNIVIKGLGVPYFEDKLNKIKIGNVIFRRIKGCVRCKLTTFDTEKGIFRPSVEPLETLYEDRVDKTLGGPVFAQNFCCDVEGGGIATIKVGDEVVIIE